MLAVRRSLIGDLELAVQKGSKEDRVDTLRRITDLFLKSNDRLTHDQIDVFDEVIGHLIKRVEARAVAELSERIAPIENAPIGVVQSLAHNDEIAVAAPVLKFSVRLTRADLVEVAQTKGQEHLLAISGRKELEALLTDILIQRGNTDVHLKLAQNPGAQFSESGIAQLVRHAELDGTLTEKLGLRLDIPLHLLRRLLARAEKSDCGTLLAIAPAEHQEELQGILRDMRKDADCEPAPIQEIERAMLVVSRMNADGELDEVALLQFVKSNQYEEVVAALSLMCSIPYEPLDRILQSDGGESLLVPCRAAGISWRALRAILEARLGDSAISEQDLIRMRKDYSRLSVATAQRLLQLRCRQLSTSVGMQNS
jgi:uncharacterized protein (DUF2336 family)